MTARTIALVALLALASGAGAAERSAATSEADMRLATIGDRLAIANVALCDRRQPRPGWMLHAVDQYLAQPLKPGATVAEFAAPVAVALVVPGAPAARAGVVADDAVVAIADAPAPVPPPGRPSSRTRDAADALVADQPADRSLAVTLLRDGKQRAVTLPARPGCRVAFEVLAGGGLQASSDGRIVQLSPGFFSRYTDAEIAAVVAHELAHAVLRHRERLEAAGVQWGLLAEFGRNRRLFRRTEDEADLLSVALLYNAGYDAGSAAAFWRVHGNEVGGGFFRARTHGSAGARAAAMAAAAAAIPGGAPRPYQPPVLATRAQALD